MAKSEYAETICVGDFETCRDCDPYGNLSMRVWLFDICFCDTYQHITFTNISRGFEYLSEIGDVKLYFHNLKFDGSYIADYLLRNGWKWVPSAKYAGEFDMLISDTGQWFCGTICYAHGKRIRLYDSLKKIPLPVRSIGAAYNLPISKSVMDYGWRGITHQPSDAELEYVRLDTECVARALMIHLSEGLDRMTIAADSLAGIERTIPDWYDKLGIRYFREHPEIDEYCRAAYFGGISYVNPEISEKTVGAGMVYDVNSLYPYVMRTYPYPVYHPVRIYGASDLDKCLWIARFAVHAEHIPGALPTLRVNGRWVDGEYTGVVTLTSVDFSLMLENYVVDYKFLDGWKWRHSDDQLFRAFVDYWGDRKMRDVGGKRQIDKLMLNSGYGKFGTNPVRSRKSVRFNVADNCVEYPDMPEETGAYYNVAIAAFVTAYARRELCLGVNASTGFCYCDTDSVHLATIDGIPPAFGGRVHPTELGAWKRESEFVQAKYLRQKTYIEERADGTLEIRACGMTDTAKNMVTWENFRIGATYPKSKLVPLIRPGGADLVERDFTIHVSNLMF